MKRYSVLVFLAAFASCDDPNTTTPLPANPPQVFLTVTENNVFGDAIKGRVNVSGCKKVAQVQVLQQESFLADVNYTGSATDFSLPAGLFASLYPQLGFAAGLTLRAKVVCDDGRTNKSTPVGVKFFPIAAKTTLPGGEQVVPDTFVAEGGVGGTPTTFLGCVRTSTGTTIARVRTTGEVVSFIGSMPFDCSPSTRISELSTTSGYRWVFEPFVGAFALCVSASCTDFSYGKVLKSQRAQRIGVGKSGRAVVWVNELGTNQNRIVMMYPQADASNDWSYTPGFAVILNADPVIDDGAGQAVWISRWEYDMGTKIADIVPYRHDLRTGQVTNGVVNGSPAVLLRQQYPVSEVNMPIMPEGFFSPSGDTFTVPLLSFNTDNTLQTTILSCSTAFGLCEGSARRWTSPTFSGFVGNVLPFSSSNVIAAIGPYQAWFLAAQTGTVLNLGEQPIVPSGTQIIAGAQAGNGTDFYVLTAPDLGGGTAGFPTEIIALDSPQAGELWRVNYGSGEAPLSGLTIAVDSSDAVWLRVGTDLVKPLRNTEYRASRGATPIP